MSPSAKHIFIHSHDMDHVRYPPHSPFDTSRAGRVRWALEANGLLAGSDRRIVPPVQAGRSTLERFHTPAYLDTLERASRRELDPRALRMGIGTEDCPVFDGVFEYSSLVSGGTVLGAEMILSGEAKTVFNPAGGHHHAHASRASGFCYLNDVVLACMVLTDAGKRVAILDLDAHHGDGVQDAFYDRNDVLMVSLHESGRTLFPGTGFESDIGVGPGEGFSVNIPFPMGVDDEAYLNAFTELVMPLLGAFSPDIVVLELGADALAGDLLGHLSLTNNSYTDIIAMVRRLRLPILATGGGGYSLDQTVRAWTLAWIALCGPDGDGKEEDVVFPAELQDPRHVSSEAERDVVMPVVEKTIETIKTIIFPLHGL